MNRRIAAALVGSAMTLAPLAASAQAVFPLKVVVHNVKKAVGTIRVAVCTKQTFLKDCTPYEATAAATMLVKGGIPNDKATSKFVVKGLGEPAKSGCHPKQPCPQDRRVDIEIKLQDNLSSADKNAVIQSLNTGLSEIWK